MKNRVIAAMVATLAGSMGPTWASESSALEILTLYGEDYEQDVTFMEPALFGVRIGEAFYTVDATPGTNGMPGTVEVSAGEPERPTWYFTLDDHDVLHRLHKGEVNALTMMAKEFSSDITPMDIGVMEGFQPTEDFAGTVIPLSFHFWNRGAPEIINFANEETRLSHGANVGIFYYQPGFRSGWFNILPGQHVNEKEESQTNPFPSMMMMVEGSITALIGGKEMTFQQGEAMIIPAGVSHEFMNKGDKPATGFLLMFGDGA